MRDKILLAIAVLALVALAAEFAEGQTRLEPAQVNAPRVTVLRCEGATSPISDCTGLYYVDVVTATGTELKLIAVPATVPIDPKLWSLVP